MKHNSTNSTPENTPPASPRAEEHSFSLSVGDDNDASRLSKETGISFDDARNLNKETRDLFLENSYAVWSLMTEVKLSLKDLLALDKNKREILFGNIFAAWNLVELFKIPLQKVLDLELETIKQVFNYITPATPIPASLTELVEKAAIYAQQQAVKEKELAEQQPQIPEKQQTGASSGIWGCCSASSFSFTACC